MSDTKQDEDLDELARLIEKSDFTNADDIPPPRTNYLECHS